MAEKIHLTFRDTEVAEIIVAMETLATIDQARGIMYNDDQSHRRAHRLMKIATRLRKSAPDAPTIMTMETYDGCEE